MSQKKFILSAMMSCALMAGAQSKVTDLAALYITTPGGTEITSTETYVTATMTLVNEDGTISSFPDTRVRGRGEAKFALDKKPYKLKLAAKDRLLGENGAKAKKWNLMAQHGDKTLLRNAVASFIALEAGQPFAPGARFVDFTLNGKYCGTYQLTDQIDIRKHRVNITEQPEVVDEQTNITGGYLLEIDDSADDLEGSFFSTTKGVKITIKSPDEDVILPRQIAYITEHVQKFEDALFGENWLDAQTGYKKYIDLNSLVQWYVTNEFAAEPNAFRSVYFYKEMDSEQLTFGPVWDFDFAFDNSSRFGSRPEALIAQEGRGAEWCFTWIDRIRQDPEFHKAVNTLWSKMVADGIVGKTTGYIDTMAKAIDASQQKNFGIYPINEKSHDEQHLFNSYAEGISFLKEFVTKRAAFLTDAFKTLANGGSVPEVGGLDAIDEIEAENYYVTVSNGKIKFSSVSTLEGSYVIYSTSGAVAARGAITPEITPALGNGTYILTWTIGGKTRSAKFSL